MQESNVRVMGPRYKTRFTQFIDLASLPIMTTGEKSSRYIEKKTTTEDTSINYTSIYQFFSFKLFN